MANHGIAVLETKKPEIKPIPISFSKHQKMKSCFGSNLYSLTRITHSYIPNNLSVFYASSLWRFIHAFKIIGKPKFNNQFKKIIKR